MVHNRDLTGRAAETNPSEFYPKFGGLPERRVGRMLSVFLCVWALILQIGFFQHILNFRKYKGQLAFAPEAGRMEIVPR
jgi:hypothetical protein